MLSDFVSVAVWIVQQVEHALQVLVDTGDEPQIFSLFGARCLKGLFQVRPCPDRSVNSIGVKLQVEGLAGGVQFADGFFQRIADRIADVLGRADQLGGELASRDVGLAVRRRRSGRSAPGRRP